LANRERRNDVLLINPGPRRWVLGENAPLGLAYLAAVLEEHGFRVQIFDAWLRDFRASNIRAVIQDRDPAIVGITCDYARVDEVKRIIDETKKVDKTIKTVVGGVLATLVPDVFSDSPVDYVVVGEGEYTFLELVTRIMQNRTCEDVRGLVIRRNGRSVRTQPRPLISNLDELPFPARHLLPLREYKPMTALRFPSTNMVASRGCVYQCYFCSASRMWGGKWRCHSPDYVVKEMQHLVEKYGIKDVSFTDAAFTMNMNRAEEICDLISKRSFDITWSCDCRPDAVNRSLLAKMASAGCSLIQYGIESGSPEVLTRIKKGFTVEHARKAIKMTREEGIRPFAYFIIGHPWDTPDTIHETIEFAKELNADFTEFFMAYPFPGTEFWEIARDHDLFVKEPSPEDLYLSPKPAVMKTFHVSAEDLERYRREAYLEFYFRPKYIANRLLGCRSPREVYNLCRSGAELLSWTYRRRTAGS